MRVVSRFLLALSLLFLKTNTVFAQQPPEPEIPRLPPTVVEAEAPETTPEPTFDTQPTEGYGITGRGTPLTGMTSSASEGVVGQADLQTRPLLRSTSILELVPGLIVGDHAGTGEAGQFFLRGMFLDHGNDISIEVDDVPVNLPSGAIAQGYIDTNFIIPELIERINFRKGPYYSDVGDFSTAGSVEYRMASRLPYGIAKYQIGRFDYHRAVLANSEQIGAGDFVYGFETQYYDGPWQRGEDVHKIVGNFKYTTGDDCEGMALSAFAYNNNWFNSLQVAERAVQAGIIPLYGNLDPSDFSNTSRYLGNVEWWSNDCCFEDKANIYTQYYTVDSFQNFTYYLDNNGAPPSDQRHFFEERVTVGANISRSWDSDFYCGSRNKVGAQLRYDRIPSNDLNSTDNRVLVAPLLQREMDLLNVGAYVENTTHLTGSLRSVVGLRGDWIQHDVVDELNAVNTGSADDGLLSPKASLIYATSAFTEVFVNSGFGFHTNHAHATTTTIDRAGAPTDPAPVMVQTFGAELGGRTEAIEGIQSSLAFFYSHSDSELIFEADDGVLEPNRATERIGIETNNYINLDDWFLWDIDATWSQARFVEFDPAGDFVPNAPEWVVGTGPLVYITPQIYATLRYRFIGSRPLIEDNTVRSHPSNLFNFQLGYQGERLTATWDVLNIFDSRDSDVEYFYESQLLGEPAPVEDRHFRPFEPRAMRFSVAWLF